MKEIKDGGPVFACADVKGHQEGMSLLDYFAGQALIGISKQFVDDSGKTDQIDQTARVCYQYAFAMLKAREAQ
jgi:hypothetical protein